MIKIWVVIVIDLSAAAKKLRKNSTDAERLLWKHLRMKQLDGLKFRRQEPIDGYIVDFVCYETRIIIEADGGQHDGSESDSVRDGYLKAQGFIVLRFWNNDILNNIRGVLLAIQAQCRAIHPPPTPPEMGGEGSVAPPEMGGEGSVAPPEMGGERSVAPPELGGERSVAPPEMGRERIKE